jgi:integrase
MRGLNLRTVPINWHPRYHYAIAGLKVNGKRRRLFFETAREAEEELGQLKIKARRHGQAGLDIPDDLRGMAVDCARRLKPFGKTILDATNFLLQHLTAAQSKQVDELVDDYLRAQRRSQLSARHLDDVSMRLSRFREDFASRPVRTISAQEIENWLYGLHSDGNGLAPQTLVNWRAILHAFYGWLLRRKLIDFNPVTAIPKPKVVRDAPAIWSPESLEQLLQAASAELVPVLAMGAFAGLRTSELLRLEWREIDLERKLIEVTASKAKSARRRLVKIEPNLARWLAPHAGNTGKPWPKGWRSYHEATAKLCRELELEWRENGLRHSFASYHLAHFQNAEALALQMGHTSVRMIFEHYRELVAPQTAQRYSAIEP